MNEVTLKNGAVVAENAVMAITVSLRHCAGADLAAFCELVSICRNPAHVPFAGTARSLQSRSLLKRDGRPSDLVRDVVLSAVSGEGGEMTLGSPYTEASTP